MNRRNARLIGLILLLAIVGRYTLGQLRQDLRSFSNELVIESIYQLEEYGDSDFARQLLTVASMVDLSNDDATFGLAFMLEDRGAVNDLEAAITLYGWSTYTNPKECVTHNRLMNLVREEGPESLMFWTLLNSYRCSEYLDELDFYEFQIEQGRVAYALGLYRLAEQSFLSATGIESYLYQHEIRAEPHFHLALIGELLDYGKDYVCTEYAHTSLFYNPNWDDLEWRFESLWRFDEGEICDYTETSDSSEYEEVPWVPWHMWDYYDPYFSAIPYY